MLAKKYRLPIQTAIGKRGREERFENFLVKIFGSSLPYSRFGIVLKKGSIKNSSDRNKIRRAFFNSLQTRQKDFGSAPADFLIIAGSKISELPVSEIRKEINKAFDVIIKQR